VKRFTYGLSYGAQAPTIFNTLALLRNEDLTPMFPKLTLGEVEKIYKKWWTAHPAIVEWRKRLIAGWRRQGFIATPWHGRKRYFIGGENHEEMYNHPIQGAAADIQNDSVLTLTTRYPFDYASKCGLVLQVHDQLVVECGVGEVESVKSILQESMQKHVGSMRFPAEVKTGRTWKDV
jgi:DNA polymerase-1